MNRFNNNSQTFNKFNKGKLNAANVFGGPGDGINAGEKDGVLQEQGHNLHNLTKEQYGQFLSLLENFQSGNARENFGNTNVAGGAVNFAGTMTCCNSVEHSNHSYDCFKPKCQLKDPRLRCHKPYDL